MNRRVFLSAVTGGLLAAALAAEAHQAGKVYRLGWFARERIDVLYPHLAMWPHRQQIQDFATKHRLPVVTAAREWTQIGGLISYGPDLRAVFRQPAMYAVKILKGANPADLPVEQATKFDLVINLKTAKALGLTLPPSLVPRADQVIE